MTHEISVSGCGAIYIDNERVFGSKPYGLFSTVNWSATDEDLKRIADRCLELIADRKTENSSEKPNNCEELNAYRECVKSRSFWDSKHCDGCYFDERCPFDEPKDEPTTQMKTQNSNLTFKTLEYCDICDHKGCEECIANALDEHCMPSQFNKQIEDECAKEYEELGLKELKELIEADRKTEQTERSDNADR